MKPNNDLLQRFASRPDYHQLSFYGKVMEGIGWKVVRVGQVQIFLKPFGPVSFAKLQRPGRINPAKLREFLDKEHIVQFQLEPGLNMEPSKLSALGFKATKSHFAYTKTLIVDLSGTEKQILSSFSKTTAYQMRRSLKMGVKYEFVPFAKLNEALIKEILELHSIWQKEKKVAGYDDAFLRSFWKHMTEGTMILARRNGKLEGALFLLIHHKLGMYFYQFSSREGRDALYIPSGLAYQAIKLAKCNHCDVFDLCSAYDERYPKEHSDWKGFSTYKERFHPTPVYYPQAFVRSSLFPFRIK